MSRNKDKKPSGGNGKAPVDIMKQMREIPLAEIDEDLPIRRYYSEESIFELASSLTASGVLQPILVRVLPSGRYGLVAGSRRVRAARQQGIKELPGVVLEDVDEREALILGLIENMQRENLTPFEEGWVILKLTQDHKMDRAEVAQRIKRETGFVMRRLQLLRMPEEVQEMVGRKQLSLAQMGTLARLPTAEAQVRAARQISAHRLSITEARELVYTDHPERVRAPHAARPAKPSTPEKMVLRIRACLTLLRRTKERLDEFRGATRGDLRTLLEEIRKISHQMLRDL